MQVSYYLRYRVLLIDSKGSKVRILHEPVTVIADDPTRATGRLGRCRGGPKRKPGNLDRLSTESFEDQAIRTPRMWRNWYG